MTTEFVTDAQSTKSSQTENALVLTITSETAVQEFASLHAQPLNSNTKEDAPNAHWIFNTEAKSKDAPVLMDSTLTITVFVKRFQLSQSPVMLAPSLIAQKDALLVQLTANHVQVPLFVLLALKLDSMLSMEPAELSVEMDSLPELNNAMTETLLETTDVQLHAQSNHCGPVLVSHQFVPTMARLFVEMEELKRQKNVMTEISLTEMDAATDARKNQQPLMALHLVQLKSLKDWHWWVMWTLILTTCLLFWRQTKLTSSQTRTRWRISSRQSSQIHQLCHQCTVLKERPQSWTLSTVLPFTAAEFQTRNTESNFHTITKEIVDSSQFKSIPWLLHSPPEPTDNQDCEVDDFTQFIIHDYTSFLFFALLSIFWLSFQNTNLYNSSISPIENWPHFFYFLFIISSFPLDFYFSISFNIF